MQTTQNISLNNSRTLANKMHRLALAGIFLAAGTAATPALATPAPSAPDMTSVSDSGSSTTDNITKVNKPTFTGTATPFSTVKVYAGAYLIGQAGTNAAGQWILTSNTTLADGPWVITVKQTVAGVQSVASTPLNIVVDTTSPSASKPDLTPGSDFGASNTDNFTNITTPIFQGTGSAGDSIAIYNTALSTVASIGHGTISAGGTWTVKVTTPFATGKHKYAIAARAQDLAGNVSALSSTLTVDIDTVAPATPAAPDMVAATDSGASNTDNITKFNLPTFAVKSEPFATVKLYRLAASEVLLGSSTTDATGNAKVASMSAIPDGYYNVYSRVVDQNGNPAPGISPVLSIKIDTTPPTVAGKAALASGSDTGNKGDGITTDTTPTVGGSFYDPYYDGDLTIKFIAGFLNYTVKTKVPVDTFKYSVTAPALPDGIFDVVAENIDVAGNTSQSPAFKLTIDKTAPSVELTSPAPGANLYALNSITGTASDNTSGLKNITYTLRRDSDGLYWNNAVWDISGNPVAQNTLFLSGQWNNTSDLPTGANLSAGSYTLTATVSDKADNSSSVTGKFVVLSDTVKPVVTVNTPTANQKVLISDFAAGTVSVSGDVDDNGGVTVVKIRLSRNRDGVQSYWNGSNFVADASVFVKATLTDAGNPSASWNWVDQLPTAAQLDSGVYVARVTAVDGAGNVSSNADRSFILGAELIAPSVSITNPIANQNIAINAFGAGLIKGTAGDNVGVTNVKVKLLRTRNNVTTYWNGTSFGTTSALLDATVSNVGNQSVAWSLNSQLPPSVALDAGAYTVYAYAIDASGNTKTSTGVTFNLTSSLAPIMDGSAGSS